jgi:hypothetical protein
MGELGLVGPLAMRGAHTRTEYAESGQLACLGPLTTISVLLDMTSINAGEVTLWDLLRPQKNVLQSQKRGYFGYNERLRTSASQSRRHAIEI